MELDNGDRDGRLTAGSARASTRALSAAGSAGEGGLWGGVQGAGGIRHELGKDNPFCKCTETFVNKDTRLG